MSEKKERMYHHDAFDVSHAHVGKIPDGHPYKGVMKDGVTGRFARRIWGKEE